MTTRWLAALVLAALAAPAGAVEPGTGPTARVRVIHDYSTAGVPDPALVDVRVGTAANPLENPVVATLAYGDITPFLTVPKGIYTVGVYAAGTETALVEGPLIFPRSSLTTVLARQVATGNDTFTIDALNDSGRRKNTFDASVRVIHGIPAAAADGVRVGAAGAGCLTPPLYFPATTVLSVARGTYPVGVYPPDDADCSGDPIPGLSATVTLKALAGYTAIARVKPGDAAAFDLGLAVDY
jgi:hypothetical protein